jgi:sulfur carrier protein
MPRPPRAVTLSDVPIRIMLNGDPHELPRPMTIAELLEHLSIDGRRVAVEHNEVVIRRARYPEVHVDEGDVVEIVNFVGGG